jgi:hypothetical protein
MENIIAVDNALKREECVMELRTVLIIAMKPIVLILVFLW